MEYSKHYIPPAGALMCALAPKQRGASQRAPVKPARCRVAAYHRAGARRFGEMGFMQILSFRRPDQPYVRLRLKAGRAGH